MSRAFLLYLEPPPKTSSVSAKKSFKSSSLKNVKEKKQIEGKKGEEERGRKEKQKKEKERYSVLGFGTGLEEEEEE